MCGINGIHFYRQTACVDVQELYRTRDHMFARGPDGCGDWISDDRHTGLGHRRLSLIDLSKTGAQPMFSADSKLIVTFNGEIYNYRELRSELESLGCVFRSQSDTEVILHSYQMYGMEMLNRFVGMFAFGLWDENRRLLVLARDPYGIKPLYYSDKDSTFRFASSVKALIAGGSISCEPDMAGIVGFEIFGSVPEPWTTFKAIKGLPAGCFLTIGPEGPTTPKRYFSIAETYHAAENREYQPRDLQDFLRQTLLASVSRHLIADVPIGAFLSGGIDSGALVGLMRDAGQKQIRTITLAFDAFEGEESNEAPLAQIVAAQYGAIHTTRRVDREEFLTDLPSIISAMDQPSIDGINTWFVSKAARELGLKAAISGLGGDELFGGYPTFRRIPKMLKALKYFPNMRGSERTLERVIQSVRAMGIPVHPKFSGILAYGNSIAGAYLLQRGIFLPHQLDMHRYDLRDIQRGLDELQPIEMIEREIRPKLQYTFSNVSTLESSFYMRNQLLRDVDWAGMAHSIEVRTPLVDSKVLTELAPYLARKRPPNGKALLARSPVIPLPDVIINRGKTGFGIPLSNWCTDELNVSVLVPNYDGGRLWSRVWLNKISDLFEGEKRSLAASDIPPSAEATPSGAALDKRTRPLVTNTTDDPIVKLAPSGPD